ncbi:unnamed protein product, partial [Amoebophrya sp. A25]
IFGPSFKGKRAKDDSQDEISHVSFNSSSTATSARRVTATTTSSTPTEVNMSLVAEHDEKVRQEQQVGQKPQKPEAIKVDSDSGATTQRRNLLAESHHSSTEGP